MPAESSLTIRAELAGLRKDLQSAGDMTEGKAESLVIALEKRLKAAEKAAKRTAKAQADAAKASGDWSKKLDGIGQVAAQLPGPLAQIGSMSVGAAKGLGAIGAAGAGIMVTAAAIGALALGARALANAAIEAEKRLDAAGQAALISEAARQSLDDYEAASGRLSIAIDDLTLSLGAGLAPALTTVSNYVARTIEQWNEVGGVLQWVQDIITADPAAIVAARQAEATRERAEEERKAAEERLAQLKLLGMAEDDAVVDTEIRANAIRDAAEAVREAAERERAAEKAVRDHAAALKAAEAEQVAFNASVRDAAATFDALAKAENEAQSRQAGIAHAMQQDKQEVADFARECDEATAAMRSMGEEMEQGPWAIAGNMAQRAGQMMDSLLNHPAVLATEEGLRNLAQLSQQNFDQEVAQFQRRMDLRKGEIDNWLQGEHSRIDAAVEAGHMTEKQAAVAKRAAEAEAKARKKALDQQAKDERKAIMDGFKKNKKIQKGFALVDSIRAGISLIPAFSVLGPLAPAAAAAVAATGYKVAADKIDAQKPPELPMGRVPTASPDHPRTVRIRDDEAVLNGRATAALGGPDAAQRMNDGRSAGSLTVQVQVGPSVLGTAIADLVYDAVTQMVPTPGSFAAGRRVLYG